MHAPEPQNDGSGNDDGCDADYNTADFNTEDSRKVSDEVKRSAARQADARSDALFLDLDGTLIDIARTPDEVAVPPGLVALLQRLSRSLSGGLAILTGRPLAELDHILTPFQPAAAGVHGAELRSEPGGEVRNLAGPLDSSIVNAAMGLAVADPGILIELKRSSIAAHYRNAPFARARIEAALAAAVAEGNDHLILCPGRKVIELVPRHISKGSALEGFMTRTPFRGRRPIMIGDDISDETAFDAARRLGGAGMRVAGESVALDTADFENPAHVRRWLTALAERLAA